jgi:hypothetical protein
MSHAILVQQGVQDFRRQPTRQRFLSNFIHDLLERPGRSRGQFAQAKAQQQLQFATFLGRRLFEGTGSFRVNLDGYGSRRHK